MKRISKYLFSLLLIFVAAVACRDEDLERRPSMDDNIGAITKVTANPDRTFFNLLNPLADEFVEFDLDVDGFNVTKINSVDIELVFTEKDRVYDPFQDEYVDSVYAPVVIKSVSTFPATIQITGQEVVEALGLTSVADFEVGDEFNVTFPINTADGRRLTVALNSELCNQPGQPSFGGCNVRWVVTCPSDLGGTFNYSTTNITGDVSQGANPAACGTGVSGTVTFTDQGGGIYSISDATFGQYDCAWNDSPATGVFLNDVCNKLSLSGADQYGLIYTIDVISVTPTVLTIDWENDFGDSGRTTLTRTDGKEWPAGLYTD
jgi:hypothetical protein